MRNKFDEQLSQLNHEMIEMGALCEEVIALASRALTENDKSLAARVAPLDSEIDRKERDIENLCLSCCFSSSRSRATCARSPRRSR